jgi:hypothetical protein
MIGTCDNCSRENVPVSHLTDTYCGDTTQCYLCQGDTDPDPYGEIEERVMPCSACGGDGGHDDYAGYWHPCTECDATGDFIAELHPINLSDLDHIDLEF